MKNIYLDTSSLISIYRQEPATDFILKFIEPDDDLIITDLARLEFRSAIYRAVRQKDLSLEAARERIEVFEQDQPNYFYKQITPRTWELSMVLLDRYSPEIGLRSLDSLHLAAALEVQEEKGLDLFLSLDDIQVKVAREEGVEVVTLSQEYRK